MTAPGRIIVATDFSPASSAAVSVAMASGKPGCARARPLERINEHWNWLAASISLAAIFLYLLFRYLLHYTTAISSVSLWVAIIAGGFPLLYGLVLQMCKRKFGADFLAGLSIVTAVLMGELLVATIIVLMLSGGQALEQFATRRASSVLNALASRMPSVAHRILGNSTSDIAVADIRIGDRLIVFPHEICPVDGTVESGTGTMDESFLTGEPFRIRKTSGSRVISGALNEDAALTITADKLAEDSRYARIMQVMKKAEEEPPTIRRLADRLGAFYTPIAVLIAIIGWLLSGQSERFLAVLVIATPCPLLLAIPVSIIGAISLAAKRGIVIKKPVVLEQVGNIRTMFFDKTGTLTHGEPVVTEILTFSGASAKDVLKFSGSVEQYSKHPLAGAILRAAQEKNVSLPNPENISEKPGEGLTGRVAGKSVLVTGRQKIGQELLASLPPTASGMECVVIIDGQLAGLIRFHDRPRRESKPFIGHLRPKHQVNQIVILSGDRDAEVRHLAEIVGIQDVRASLTPEQKLRIVKDHTAKAPTLFLGDGINDAPAMLSATVGVAFGQNSDITAEAASAVIMEPALGKVDELLHIGKRMRRIALESAVGGIVLSAFGMFLAALGFLPPIAGAIGQEVIDLLAVLNALRASIPGKELQDFGSS
jgi:heavy metal translocating P-type ATPase